MNEVSTRHRLTSLRLLMKRVAIVAGIALTAWIVWVVVGGVYGGLRLDRFAAFGDAMAFVGSLATALALAVGAYSLLLQREDIDQQLAEMKGSKEAQQQLAAAQEADTKLRRFEQFLSMCDALDQDIQREYDLAWAKLHDHQTQVEDQRQRQGAGYRPPGVPPVTHTGSWWSCSWANVRHYEMLCQTNGGGLSLTDIRKAQLFWNALALGFDKAVIDVRNDLTKLRVVTLRQLSTDLPENVTTPLVSQLEDVRAKWVQLMEGVRDKAHASR